MALHLLDADAVMDYMAGISSSVAIIRDLYQRQDALGLCDVVIAEVYSGFDAEEQASSLSFLTSFRFLETTREAAMLAGQWRYRYSRQGITLATTDALIAATAHIHHAVLVTGNVRHYPMPEISILPLPRANRS